MPRVIAIERGHDGRMIREVGEQFDVSDARMKDGSTWFVLVKDAPEPGAAKPKPARPPGAGPLPGSAVKAD